MTDALHNRAAAYDDLAAHDNSNERAPADGGAPSPKLVRRAWWRHPFSLLRRMWRWRLLRSRLVRLLFALGVVAIVLAIVAFGILRVLGARDKIASLTLPFVEEFTTVDLSKWLTREGVWVLRQDSLAQLANLEKPAQLYLPGKLAADQPYHVSTYVIFGGSTRAAGVNFNAQFPDLTKQQHQVRIVRHEGAAAVAGALPPPTMELVAGYTDEQGVFVPQVAVPFTLDTVQYRLDVYVLGNSFTVQLNGQTMIERRPLFYTGGLVGFVAEGPARFDALRITTAQTREPGEQVYVSDFEQTPGGAGWVPISGEWQIDEGELVQINPAAQDAAIGYEGSAFENYVVQVSLRHLIGVGGGVLFNMASPYQLNGSYIVRFSEQTDSVFWGFFDAAGMFTRQGYFDIAPAGVDAHTLAVYVGVESYDVYLDEQLLARNIPYQGATPATEEGRVGGHIGLITSRSSVAYARVEVFPLFDNSQMKLPKPQQLQSGVAASASMTATSAITPTKAVAPTSTTAAPTQRAAPAATARPLTPTPTATQLRATALPASSAALTPGVDGWQPVLRGDLNAAGWRPISGQWAFSNDALVQSDPDGIDLAIAYTGAAFREYTYSVDLTHREGNAAGILFNMPYTDRINGAHMVRYSERRPGGIFWGYFDNGGKFVGQGYANVDPPADARHTLRVVSGVDVYSVYLDDFLLAADLPLQQNFGYVGLVTVKSTASFDQIKVGPVATAARPTASATPVAAPPARVTPSAQISPTSSTATVVRTFPERRVLSGRWELEGDLLRQTAPDPGDYILNTGVAAANYRVEADILLPTKPETGAGFLIHMPERGRRHGATIVRFTNGGDGLFWGVFDATGAFVGRQAVDIANKPEGDNLFHLAVDVRGPSMDIWVDDALIAADVVVPRGAGWIGLVTHGGPVTFGQLQISLEEATP